MGYRKHRGFIFLDLTLFKFSISAQAEQLWVLKHDHKVMQIAVKTYQTSAFYNSLGVHLMFYVI